MVTDEFSQKLWPNLPQGNPEHEASRDTFEVFMILVGSVQDTIYSLSMIVHTGRQVCGRRNQVRR